MTAPRIEVDLDKLAHNASTLVSSLGSRGISVTGVTKAVLGAPVIARTLLSAGIAALGDSRIENVVRMRRAGITAPITLIRSPMLSQVDLVVEHADTSCNTEPVVLRHLAAAAVLAGCVHGVVLMVELGDLREGILPADLDAVVASTLALPGLELRGLGTNLACQNGVVPTVENMGRLSALASHVETTFDIRLDRVSGGNSANLGWALGAAGPGRIDDLRLGEAILLGRETVHLVALEGLHTDAIVLVGEVIESKLKPDLPTGERGRNAFGGTGVDAAADATAGSGGSGRGVTSSARTIVAIGEQDTDTSGLSGPSGTEVVGGSSDHLIVRTERLVPVGSELRFELDYSALLRSMTSPFVALVTTTAG